MNYTAYDLTQSFEGCRLEAYNDSGGVPTIGWGHTGPEVHLGLTWTQQQADDELVRDMASAVDCVNTAVKVPLNQNQFNALCDFTFNCGRGNFLGSTLLKILNLGNYIDVPAQIEKWVYADGQKLAGLIRRRQAEAALFVLPPEQGSGSTS